MVTRFRQNARLVTWAEDALLACYYCALPEHSKDQLLLLPKFTSLEKLIKHTICKDQRYLERQADKGHSHEASKDQSATLRGNHKAKPAKGDGTEASTPKTKVADPSRPPLDAKGHLSQAEKQCRKDLGLCGFCGAKEHNLDNCPLRPKTSLRAADTVPAELDIELMLDTDFFEQSKN